MAKKDLLEKLSQAPADSRARRSETDEPKKSGRVVQTRVSRKVVRRRRKPKKAEARKAEEPKKAEAAEPEKVEAAEPEKVEAAESEKVEAKADEAPQQDQGPVAEEQAAEEPAEESPEEQSAESGEEQAEQSDDEQPAPQEIEVLAGQDPAQAAVAAAAREERGGKPLGPDDKEKVPDQARYEGLGKAVVMPPPGYDPTNPKAFREQQERQQERKKDKKKYRGRRRVAGGSDYSGRRRRGGMNDGPMRRKRRRRSRKRGGGGPAKATTPAAHKRKIRVDNVISVSQLAHEMGEKASAVIKELMGMGQMATANEMLDIDTATLVADVFGYQVENVGFQEDEFIPQVGDDAEEENLQPRPPVITIMGHVDHGKTTLLDAIRDARVAQGEAGGITQHIGAYQVEQDGKKVTFVDTPGHAAFTEMRARGAQVTDVVVLVVAADDGVQPQTEEAISHAKAAGVPIIVAINKMDKPDVNPDAIKTQLTEYELNPEEWGGDTLYAEVSALKQQGIDDLLEQVLLQSEILELRANPDRYAEGVVIESKMERGKGAVATVLVQKGTLQQNDHVVLGATYGKVRAMTDFQGNRVDEAGPSTPVEIFGLNDLPEVGDTLSAVESEKNAKTLAEHRADQRRQEEMARQRKKTAEDLFAMARGDEVETLNIILKTDVHGSLEAIRAALEGLEIDGTEVNILHAGVGSITESDVNLAAANDALLVGFSVNIGPNARSAASGQGIEPEMFDVIYKVLDRVKQLLGGMLDPEYELIRQGEADVRQLFKVSRVGTIAGCYIFDGKISRNHHVKLKRDGEVVWEGEIDSLKRFKEDVKEVTQGYECGISLQGFDDIQEGDRIESFSVEEIERVIE